MAHMKSFKKSFVVKPWVERKPLNGIYVFKVTKFVRGFWNSRSPIVTSDRWEG